MPPGNDPMASLLGSVQLVKDAFSPIELEFRRVAKDLGTRWDGVAKTKCVRSLDNETTSFRDYSGSNKVSITSVNQDSTELSKPCGDNTPVKVPLGCFFTMVPFANLENGNRQKDSPKKKSKDVKNTDEQKMKHESCSNCFQFPMLVNDFVKSFPNPFKPTKKRIQKPEELHKNESVNLDSVSFLTKEEKHVSLECLVGLLFDQLSTNLQKLEEISQGNSKSGKELDGMKSLINFWETQKNSFIGNLSFARVGGIPSSVVTETPESNEEVIEEAPSTATVTVTVNDTTISESNVRSSQKLSDILSIPLSNVERLKSTLSTISIAEFIELVPYINRSSKEYPDKKKLFSVQDFFRYTEAEGRRFFEELDRDGDGQVTLEDLEIAMGKRKLPKGYAREFMQRTKSNILAKSFGWKQFLSLMEQKEPTILRAYTSLCSSKHGTLQKSEILTFLKNAGLPANDDNAIAMMRFLNVDNEKSISYGHFRNFMVLLPSETLQDDFRNIWFEAATVVAVAPPMTVPTGNVLRSALAGGLSCALSCCVMHPVDTVKTRVQASAMTVPEVLSKLPEIGVRGLYRGSIPAIVGQFSSHGLRTGIFEATKIVLINVAPDLHDFQVQSIASFCSTFLGTAVRIPCEVLKQRLQAGIFQNVREGIVGTWQADGLRGFFRGTGATLCREVPFYVAGMGLYAESKKAAQRVLRRELEPWETIAVGALSGGLAAIATTPFDVMKTRMMTAPQGRPVSMSLIAFSILKHEGPLGLFKGAVPRFFWIAPLGAMNFAGYELARKAMDNEPPIQSSS